MRTLFKCLSFFFVVISFFASCSRPVAHFQPSAREHFAAKPAVETPTNSIKPSSPTTFVMPEASLPTEQLSQAKSTLDQVDALVRNDSKLVSNKTLQKRLNRIRSLMAATSAKASLAPGATNAPRKMNLVERLVVKKMNKKISKQLAPANPDKAKAVTGMLALGAILVLGGIVLLLVTTGTGATIGVVAILGGLVLLLLGLL